MPEILTKVLPVDHELLNRERVREQRGIDEKVENNMEKMFPVPKNLRK